MNRRSFIERIIKAAVAPMILPAALTYARRWKEVNGVYIAGWDIGYPNVCVVAWIHTDTLKPIPVESELHKQLTEQFERNQKGFWTDLNIVRKDLAKKI